MLDRTRETALYRYHGISIVLHWVSAITVFALFAVGFWMVDLDYYSSWYQTAPNWHRSVGVLLACVTCIRLCCYIFPRPARHKHKVVELWAAKLVKISLLCLLLGLFISGYFITTAVGDALFIFDWFSIPSIIQFDHLEEYAGQIHEIAAWSLISLTLLHAAAAIKHHVIDKDDTLLRMTFASKKSKNGG